jgi:CRP/FNR family transcriptional regulator
MHRTDYRQDDLIVETATGCEAYFIARGTIRLSQLGPTGRDLTLDYLGPGGMFGAIGAGAAGPTRALAASAATICRLPRSALAAFLATHPPAQEALASYAYERLARMHARFAHFAYEDARGRLLASLDYLAATHGAAVDDGVRVGLRLTHQDLARLTGSSRETVSQQVGRLRREGLLRFEGKFPVVLAVRAARHAGQSGM